MKTRYGAGLGFFLFLGCGAGQPTPTSETAAPSGTAVASTEEDDAAEGCPIAARKAAEAANAEASKPIIATGEGVQDLAGLLTKGAAGFPSGGASDVDCIGSVGLTGKSAKDYESLADKCGTGTGMKEFTSKVSGKLDAASHPRDTYAFTMLGGFCYRMFVVGDTSLETINVRVHRPNGALLSLISAKHSVAILDPKEPWCKKTDRPFHIVIEARDKSAGAYTFGIWARPAK